jgi:phosphate-selective porin OprO/OprP
VKIRRAAALASLALLPFAGAAHAQNAPNQAGDSNTDLRAEIEEQKQRLAILERKLELQQEAATAAAASAPKITANATRFQIGSPDNSNFIRFRGTLFADNRAYAGDSAPETADTFLLRSVRPTFEGTFAGIYDFRFTPDFGSGRSIIVDAYAAARFKPGFVVTVGKFKPSVGLERLASEPDLRFMERGLPTLLVPNRDLGVQLSGEFAGGAFAYQVGYFNGVTDGQSSDNLALTRLSRATPAATTRRACSSSRSSTPTTSTCAVSASASVRPGRTSMAPRPTRTCRPTGRRAS